LILSLTWKRSSSFFASLTPLPRYFSFKLLINCHSHRISHAVA
jgi:hypothetical protein